MAKILYQKINRDYGYYELTIRETEKSIIVIERTNQSGGYDKEIRYHKDKRIMQEIDYMVKTDDVNRFAYLYAESRENPSYWQSWKKIF